MEYDAQKIMKQDIDSGREEDIPGYHTTPTTVGGLRTHTVSVLPGTPMGLVIRELENSPELPGVLIYEKKQYIGLLSRRKIYERMSRPYAIELFIKHPASRFYSDFEIFQTPILSRMRVEDAVRLALGRSGEHTYEPLVILHDDGRLSLLDMQVLLLAQSQLLVNANRVVEQLYNISSVISGSLDVNIILDTILDYLAETIPYHRCVVLFFKHEQVDFAALRGFPQEVDIRQMRQVVLENSVYETVRHSKGPMCIDDVLSRKEWPHLPHVPPARTWLGLPLIHAGEVSGMLVAISLEPDAYSEEQIQLAQKIAEQAAIALRNAMLYKEVKVFNQQLESAIQERTRDLEDILKKLEATNTSKTEFLKTVASELSDPLRKIEGHKQFFLTHSEEANNPFVQDLFANIAEGIGRLREVVERVQDVAAIESNEFALQHEAVEVGKLFERLRNKFLPTFQERRLSLHLLNLDLLPDLHGDSRLLFKAFGNLVENAILHTPMGGKIIIKGIHRVTMQDNKAHSEVQITVSDNGKGIDIAVQDKIFDKTFRYRPSKSTNQAVDTHAGLGLAIVDGIVRAHGGRVWVESRGRDVILNPGSHFHVVVPVMQGIGKSSSTLKIGAIL
jgi:signal transduction histidine kinase